MDLLIIEFFERYAVNIIIFFQNVVSVSLFAGQLAFNNIKYMLRSIDERKYL